MEAPKMKRVVIACDYHQTAQKTVEEGYTLAKSIGAEVYLLHIVDHYSYYKLTEFPQDERFAQCMKLNSLQLEEIEERLVELEKYLENIKKYLNDTGILTIVKDGDPTESIIKEAEDIEADIIVINSHSRKWTENMTMGSVAEKLFKHSPVPLLIVPVKKH